MTNTVFRSQQTEISSDNNQSLPKGSQSTTGGGDDTIEVPYLDYENQKGNPFIVDYYKLGSTWQESLGGFAKEVQLINNHIKNKIESGEIANSQSAVKELIKTMEKTNNLQKEERVVIKMEILAAYVDFLDKKNTIKSNLRKYAYA